MDDVTAFVLAGGQGRRMGGDKALLVLHGKTLLQHALSLAHQVAPRVAILGPRERYAATEEWVVEDVFPGCGPLGGIHAALHATRTELNLILAVDMPFVPVNFLARLLERAQSSLSAQVVAPRWGGVPQATCSVCRRAFRTACEQRLRQGLYKVQDAMTAVPAEFIEEEGIRQWGFGADIFRNLNSPADFSAAQDLKR